jgi:hypothetical protein
MNAVLQLEVIIFKGAACRCEILNFQPESYCTEPQQLERRGVEENVNYKVVSY